LISSPTIFYVYRPAPAATKSHKPVPFSDFSLTFLSLAATTPHEFIFTGDFNLHLDYPNNSQAHWFLSVLNSNNLTQHVSFSAHRGNHTLDLVITANTSSFSPAIDYSPVSPSDHFAIFSTLTISPLPPPPLSEFSFRYLKSMSISNSHGIFSALDSLLILQIIYLILTTLTMQRSLNFSTSMLHSRLEVFTLNSKSLVYTSFVQPKICFRESGFILVHLIVSNYFTLPPTTITPPLSVPKSLQLFIHLVIILWSSKALEIHEQVSSSQTPISQLPSTIDSKSLPSMFASFFSDKVLTIHSDLNLHVTETSPQMEPSHIPTNLTFFSPATEEDICKLASQSFNTFCDMILYPLLFWNSACLHFFLP